MSKMTLLDIVQNILSAMDAEEVNSINDTIESMQVADEVKTTYYENLGNFDIPNRFELVLFESVTDSEGEHPTTVKTPDNVDHFEWLKYNIGTLAAPVYKNLVYCEPKEFLETVMDYGGSKLLVKDINSEAPLYIGNDKDPDYWTTFDDEHIVFDSFNSSVDTGRVSHTKLMALAQVLPSWTVSDSFIPDLLEKHTPLLLAEAKSACFINYKGVSSAKEEQRARRQRVRLQDNRSRNKKVNNTQNDFGRS